MTAVIELDRVSVTYRAASTPALVDASLTVHEGEIVLVAGPSGCGKSTLLRVINGLVPRSYRAELRGTYRVAGQDSAGLPIRTISETVGTLLQDPAKQVVGHTVLAELAFGLENRGVPPAEIRRRAQAVAERLHIGHLLAHAPHELSGGQLQLVAFAGILVLEPRLIVVDEPLANLDPDAADLLLQAIADYVAEGGAAVIVEHRVDEVLSLGPSRVLYLENGRVHYSGSAEGFLKIASPVSVKLPFRALLDSAHLPEGPGRPERNPTPPDGSAGDGSAPAAPVLASHAPKPGALDTGAPARIRYDRVDLGYRDVPVLREVHCRFEPGQRIAVLGRNGAGKSTLMRAAVGLVEPSRGRILLDDIPVAELGPKRLVATLGYLFQDPGQALFSDTVAAELAFGPRNLGASEAEIEAISRTALEAVALHDVPEILSRPPRTLSFGQQRRLAVALALTLRPRTLILDEPTAGQDQRSSHHFLNAVWRIPEIDSIYFITHDIDIALSGSDRVVVVDRGGIAADASPAEIVRNESLWHTPRARSGSPGGRHPAENLSAADAAGDVLRETDFVRAARKYGPERGNLPSAIDLARQLRSRQSQLPTTTTKGTNS